MLNCDLKDETPPVDPKLRVCAVSYLNTVPLVWGLLRGPQRHALDLQFAIPAVCADRLKSGEAHIGIVPSAELPRLGLTVIRGTGIASEGAVRSILLISRVPFEQIRTLATDSSSRTSVMLARILLAKKYGCEPVLIPMAPDVPAMLEAADSALIIGDPALHVDPETIPFHVADLGAEWTAMTGLPMVFAVWAARPGVAVDDLTTVFTSSYEYGRAHLEEIVRTEAAPRGLTEGLARDYLTHHIRFELGPREYKGMDLFLQYAAELGSLTTVGKVPA